MVFIELIAGFTAQIPTRQQYDKRDEYFGDGKRIGDRRVKILWNSKR